MKKFVLLLSLICAVGLVGCGQEKVGEGSYKMATGSQTGTYYPLGGAMAELFCEIMPQISMSAEESGGSVDNCKKVSSGEADFAIIQNDILDYAYNGTESFAGGSLENLRAVASLYPEIIQIVVAEEKGVTDISQLRGMRVSVGAEGSGVEANARQILEAAGMSYNDIDVEYLSFADSADALKSGRIDAFFATSGVPNASIQQLTDEMYINIVSISDGIAEKLIAGHPFYAKYVIPGGTYTGEQEDANTVAIRATLVARDDLPEALVYEMTKATFENQTKLIKGHTKASEFFIKNALMGVSVPLHPGAEKYFKEVGIM